MKDDSRLDELFADALQKPPDVRERFVAQACASDHALKAEVLSLLTAAEESGAFLGASALDRLAEEVARDGWSVRAGDRVGAYTVLRLLGSGGAGQVWCARDERLGREVAIKMLLPFFAGDPERVRRFGDEARLASALNHSNILTVYDVGDYKGAPFLVSERLDGETLRKRLQQGSLPVDKALAIALPVARGLAAAHTRGILHRDLKPENVFLVSNGGVKILDFGIATLLPATPDSLETDGARTIGAIVGTVGYMAPEQLTGASMDARADLFAFGVMLYEMLAGRRPFDGTSSVDTLQAVIAADPAPLLTANPSVTDALAGVVHRLLEKNPESRFQSAADLAWTLERLSGTTAELPHGKGEAPRSPARRRPWVAGLTAAAALVALVTWSLLGARASERGVNDLTTLSLALPAGIVLDSAPSVAPIGRRLALAGRDKVGISRIYVRDLGEFSPRAIGGTEGAKQPFWSPDGQEIGFFARGKLMRVAANGGAPIEIAPAPDARGGTWGRNGVIVFQTDYRDTGLSQVRVSQGSVEAATRLDVSGPDVSHRWPVFLPDDVHFLYLVVSTDEERRGVYLASIAAPNEPPRRLFESSSGAVYVPGTNGSSGTLLSAEGDWIEARLFDMTSLSVIGDPHKIDVAAAAADPHHAALLSASTDILAFSALPIPYGAHLTSMKWDGTDVQLRPTQELGFFLRLSPDEGRIARVRVDPVAGNPDIWVTDLKRGGDVRITTSRDIDVLPVWSPNATQLAYRSGINAAPTLVVAAADGTGTPRTLRCPRPYCEPTDWVGDTLIVNASDGNVWSVPVAGGEPRQLLHDALVERDARVSRNGLWIAYVSEESGHPDVFVRSLSGPDRKFPISTGGGDQPVWRRDEKGLFYVDPEGFLEGVTVRATADGGLEFSKPTRLMVPKFAPRHWGTTYDVSTEERVYFPSEAEDTSPRDVGVVVGWSRLAR